MVFNKVADPIWVFLRNADPDPLWMEVIIKARKTAPKKCGEPCVYLGRKIQGLVNRTRRVEGADARSRRLRDENIANADEEEISTSEKVLLLVSSCLNDKKSFPGHVYRHLILEHQNRERERRWSRWEEDVVMVVGRGKGREDSIYGTIREDTHAVIKHTMMVLLAVRPEFGSSGSMMEMSVTAVEALVFGEVYDSVFLEIIDETREIDEALMTNISEFQIEVGRRLLSDNTGIESSKSRSGPTAMTENTIMVPTCDIEEFVSGDALKCLRKLPESHTVAEKLSHCVQFLGCIAPSSQFHIPTNENQPPSDARGVPKWKKKISLGADSLLKMVCQHIIVAKVPNLNAEIFFLEEFARDEQLLKGREGYALVTISASLHFMNSSTNFGIDIFHNDDEDC